VTISKFGPADPALDHLVYAAPDLDAAVAAFAEATGVDPAEGGRHIGRGTRNYLVAFGPTSYLEIIGPDLDHPADDGATAPFGVDTLDTPRLISWAVQPADIVAAAEASAAAGADLGEIWPLSRRTPAGDLLEWRLASPDFARCAGAVRGERPFDGITPFLIDWGTTAHPASSGLPWVKLLGLRATHPEPAGVAAVVDALDVRLAVEHGPPSLVALIDTPRGPVVLS
jgi:hypothetical protein